MQGFINKSQIDYIFYHLNFFVNFSELYDFILFNKKNDKISNSNKIFFNLSDYELNIDNIFEIDNIPVLFPNNTLEKFYYFENKSLVFNHDILKSTFYLLSGYQETQTKERDKHDRFEFKNSIQKKLNITKKPIVNYYFDIIIKGLKEFGKRHNIEIIEKNIFKNPIFELSHDVDTLHNRYYLKIPLLIKQALNLKPSLIPKKNIYKLILKYSLRFPKEFWSFKKLTKLLDNYNLKSTFYFLDNDLPKDSQYSLIDKKIKNIQNDLINKNFQVGLHGSYKTYKDFDKLKAQKEKIYQNIQTTKIGNRQHYLRCSLPKTFILLDKAGFYYDATLGFAEHEGFRNSYCHPFKLYDFKNDKMLDIWQIPLTVMEFTLLSYRKLNYEKSLESVTELLEEIKKFNGFFSLLWHNDTFDEVRFKGITNFFENILVTVKNFNFTNNTASAIIDILSQLTPQLQNPNNKNYHKEI